MSQLDRDLGGRACVHVVDDALPCRRVLRRIEPGAALRDPRIGRDAHHFGEHEAGAAVRAAAQVDEVEVVGRAVDARVLRHRRHDDAVLERHAAQRERREHRRHRGRRFRRGSGEPALHPRDVGGIAQPQVLVRDALAARQQAVRELLGFERRVARDVLEPLGGIARGVLDLEDLERPRRLVLRERRLQVVGRTERARERDRILQRELGARTHGEVRGVRGVPQQDHRHGAAVERIPVHPRPADDAREADPDRAATQVSRVRQQWMSVEPRREQPLAVRDALLLRHRGEPRRLPRRLGRLHDERRRVPVVLVRMRLEPAVRRLDESKRERREQLLRAQPDEPALPRVDVGRERVRVPGADPAVEAIGGQHDVGAELARDGDVVGDVLLEYLLDAERLAARLQDFQQALAADAAEAVAAGGDRAALEVDVDVVPVVERSGDRVRSLGVGDREVAERLVGEHDAPAERVAGPVALDDPHRVPRVRLLEQQRGVEPRRAAADARHAHVPPPFGSRDRVAAHVLPRSPVPDRSYFRTKRPGVKRRMRRSRGRPTRPPRLRKDRAKDGVPPSGRYRPAPLRR